MTKTLKKLVVGLLSHLGYRLVKVNVQESLPFDIDEEAAEIIGRVRPYTLTSVERLYSLIQATRYIAQAKISGSVVECGVWRGGSMMAVALTLSRLNRRDIDLYLFDTFEGMTEPTNEDRDYLGSHAGDQLEKQAKGDPGTDDILCYAPLEEVTDNLLSTGYPRDHMHFVKGRVEQTIPGSIPPSISLLRLDTDWYESTWHELTHLFPRLEVGGVLIIDDYGHWQGCRKAVEEYFSLERIPILMNRIDYTGRVAVKIR